MDVLQLLCFVMCERIKCALSLSGMKENNFMLVVLCWNGTSGVVDGKPYVSMPLSRNGFTMLTHVFLVF